MFVYGNGYEAFLLMVFDLYFKMEIQCLKNGWKSLKCAIYLSMRSPDVRFHRSGYKIKIYSKFSFCSGKSFHWPSSTFILLLKCIQCTIHIYLSDQVCQYGSDRIVNTINSYMHSESANQEIRSKYRHLCLSSAVRLPPISFVLHFPFYLVANVLPN